MKLSLISLFFIPLVIAIPYCPILSCDGAYSNQQNFTCYQHNGGSYDNMIMTASSCGFGQRCETNSSYVPTIAYSGTPSYTDKKLYAWCSYEEAFWKNFYPGSKCLTNFQCKNFNCTWRCTGRPENALCYDDSECDIGLFCKDFYLSTGTRYKACSPLYNESQTCVNGSYTYQCANGYKCTQQYSNQAKQCLKLYSLAAGNSSLDSDLCESSKLNYGKCVDIEGMRSNGITLESPYQCSLEYDSNCYAIYSDGAVVYYEPCQCSLSSKSVAYCPFPGKDAFKSVYSMYRETALQSSECHINVVKNNILTEWEMCTSNATLFQSYKTAYRNLKEWALQQDNTTYECYQQLSQLTEFNQSVYTTFTKSSGMAKIIYSVSMCIISLVLIL